VLSKTNSKLEHRYRTIGARRFHQHVPLPELAWAILAKQTLWEFLSWESVPERPSDAIGEPDLLQLL
jgi:hypothetical protein